MENEFRKIKRGNPEGQYKKFFITLHTILGNILDTDDEHYRKISGSSKKFIDSISNTAGGIDFLTFLGFKRRVIEYKEYYILETLSTTAKFRLRDIQTELSDLIANLRVKEKAAATINSIKKAAEYREKEIDRIMKGFEEDRQEKDERNKRNHAKIKHEQEKKESEMSAKMAENRARLAQVNASDFVKKDSENSD